MQNQQKNVNPENLIVHYKLLLFKTNPNPTLYRIYIIFFSIYFAKNIGIIRSSSYNITDISKKYFFFKTMNI